MASPGYMLTNGSAGHHQSPYSGAVRSPPALSSQEDSMTGLVYDVKMRFHTVMDPLDNHPEDPRRIWSIFDKLKQAGCLKKMRRITTREATEEEVLQFHSKEHWDLMTRTKEMDVEELMVLQLSLLSIYLNNDSAFCARLSCGSTIEICKEVASGRIRNGFAIVRPPGHHAEPGEAQGFCLFNNVAIATRSVQKEFPDIKRVMILDWDVHHGNGIQRAFYEDPNVLYVSIHRHDNGRFYPSGDYGAADKCGEGLGVGRNVNIPWPKKGMGDADYVYAFQRIVMPIAYEFAPDMVIVSAGFDAAAGDEIGECFVTPNCYGHMTHMLSALANGKICVVLEGGYNLDSIANSALACTKVLLGEAPGPLRQLEASPLCVETVHEVAMIQSQHWTSLLPKYLDPLKLPDEVRTMQLNEVIRAYRSSKLFDKYELTRIPISKSTLAKVFQGHITASVDFYTNQVLVVNVHHGSDVRGNALALTNKMNVDNSVVVDSDEMLKWTLDNKFGLIDLEIPESEMTVQLGEMVILTEPMKEIITYIWDNFIDLSDAKSIVLVGYGGGCMAVCHLISQRLDSVVEKVRGVVQIVQDKPLAMVANRDAFRKWYHENSFVVVPTDHVVWDSDAKITKKYGSIIKFGRTAQPESKESTRMAQDFIFGKVGEKEDVGGGMPMEI